MEDSSQLETGHRLTLFKGWRLSGHKLHVHTLECVDGAYQAGNAEREAADCSITIGMQIPVQCTDAVIANPRICCWGYWTLRRLC